MVGSKIGFWGPYGPEIKMNRSMFLVRTTALTAPWPGDYAERFTGNWLHPLNEQLIRKKSYRFFILVDGVFTKCPKFLRSGLVGFMGYGDL